jgi:hypothetical protein
MACGANETIQHRVAIEAPPAALDLRPPSGLQVPKSCPVYAPGGGDVDTPEAPFPDGFTIVCGVDDTGATYGLVNGDAPTAHPAVLPGGREIGVYFGFKKGAAPAALTELTGADAGLQMWSAPTRIFSRDCCAELHPEGRLSLRAVASGPEGLLVSAGYFNGSPTQVAGRLTLSPDEGWVYRFYVNAEPAAAP